MKPISSLLVLLFFIISAAAYSQSFDSVEYDPEVEEEMMREDDQLPNFEAYAPGEIEHQEEVLEGQEESEWALQGESLPEKYYEEH